MLKTQTISGQLLQKHKVLPAAQHITGLSSVISSDRNLSGISGQPLEISGCLDTSDIVSKLGSLAQAFIPGLDLKDLIYNPIPGIVSGIVDINQEDKHGKYVHGEDVGFSDIDAPLTNEDEGNQLVSPIDPSEDTPDPFLIKNHCTGQRTADP